MNALVEPIVCCAPLAASTLSDAEAEATAELFKALGEPARVRLVNLLARFTLKRDAVETLAAVADMKGACC
jgi:DNA-binding transcriptional ArsR family regulator